MLQTLRRHWPEYAIEAALLATFMVSAALFGLALEHPRSALHAALPAPFLRRVLMGLAMGATAVALIYSRFGQRSGAHMNPSVTLTFLHLGKVRGADAGFYVAAQFLGAAGGMALADLALHRWLADPAVRHVATSPGALGPGAAFAAELAISFATMTMVLASTSHAKSARYTGLFAGCLVAAWITFEAPLSGMSMNPARSLGSALAERAWTGLWVYFTAPVLGMLLAAEVYPRLRRARPVRCAKLHHDNPERCIFCGANA